MGGHMSRILIIIAVLPALILLGFIYMRDRKEKPPVKLMVLLLALGAGTIIPAVIAEFIGQLIIAQTDTDHQTMLLVLCFLVIGIVEELGKYLVTVCTTWKSREFQHSYDGVIYMVCASLGFAILENILYVASGGIGTGILRAFTAIPLHCTVGVIMGALYAKGREAAYAGDHAGMIGFMAWAYIVPVFIHGLYDYLVMAASYGYISEAWVFLILGVMYVLSIFLIFTVQRMTAELTADRRLQIMGCTGWIFADRAEDIIIQINRITGRVIRAIRVVMHMVRPEDICRIQITTHTMVVIHRG